MSLNQKFLAQVRAVTRSLMRRGPAAVRTVSKESIKNAVSVQAAAAKSVESKESIKNAVPVQAAAAKSVETLTPPASNQSAYDTVSDMLADLSRLGLQNNPFNVAPLSGGTAAAGLPGHFIDASYTNDAGTRSYKLYVPASHTGQASPLVVMLHGCTQHPDDFALGTGMNLLAEEYGCLVVYPAQSQQANASRCWNWFSAADQQRGHGEPAIIAGLT